MDRTDLLQRNYRNIKVASTMCGIFVNVQRNLPEDIVEEVERAITTGHVPVEKNFNEMLASKQLTIGEYMPSLRDLNPELYVYMGLFTTLYNNAKCVLFIKTLIWIQTAF